MVIRSFSCTYIRGKLPLWDIGIFYWSFYAFYNHSRWPAWSDLWYKLLRITFYYMYVFLYLIRFNWRAVLPGVDIDPRPSRFDPISPHFPVVSVSSRRSLSPGYNLFNFIISLWIVCLMSAHNHQPVHMSRWHLLLISVQLGLDHFAFTRCHNLH